MSDETRRVLDLLAQGKITADEAEKLLAALGAPAATAAADAASDADPNRPAPRWVRINVHRNAREGHREKDVNIRVPFSIVRSGIRLGAILPGLAGDQLSAKMREKGLDVDFTKLGTADIETMLRDLTNIEIDDGKSQVRISCE
jgi:hypothetical protein